MASALSCSYAALALASDGGGLIDPLLPVRPAGTVVNYTNATALLRLVLSWVGTLHVATLGQDQHALFVAQPRDERRRAWRS